MGGNYACNATSKLGYAYGQAALNVIPNKRIVGGGSCEGMTELREEVSMLKMVIHELKDMMEAQHKLLMHTHEHQHMKPDHTHDDMPVASAHTHDDMATEEENTTESFRAFRN